jgi:trehalose/maltose hydrolase-like predicted phosphorylase
LFYLLSADELGELLSRLAYDYDDGLIPRTIAYYEPRTSHGSTLSRVVHAWIHARANRTRSWSEFLGALHSDINDVQGGTTAEGIHLGAMAGTIDLIQRCYTGIELRHDELRLNPVIPDELGSLTMGLRYRDRSIRLDFTPDLVRLWVARGPSGAIRVRVRDELREVHPGETVEFKIDG